jgi:hypothetical protein
MARDDDEQFAVEPGDAAPEANGHTLLFGVASGGLFLVGLLVTESVGEIAVDVDLKPFFVPYLLIAVARYGIPTLSVGLGAALGEGVLDVSEGYELDDPVGFIGYVLGFTAFGWYLHGVAEDPSATSSLVVASILGAFVQAVFEGFAFLVFDSRAGVGAAALSVFGNTVAHGVVLGAVPLVLLYPLARDRTASRV